MENTVKLKNKSYLGNRLKEYFSKPANIILVAFGIILSLTILVPLVFLLYNTFQIHIGEGHIGPYGSLTLFHWKNILTRTTNDYSKIMFWIPLWNSIKMAILSCIIAVAFGGSVAFLITRTNLPGKKFISLVFIFPYIMPSWSIAMFWENFFGNSYLPVSMGTQGILQGLTGIATPGWLVYGFIPTSIALGVHYAPFAYILIGGILRNMDANLEEAATILKSNRFKTLRKVTLPIVMPAIISTILLVFASSISSYTVPMFLGVKGNFWTLSLRMKYLVGNAQTVGQGYVISVILLLFSVAILLANHFMTGKRKSFTTVTGKSSQVSLIKLRKSKWPITTVIFLLVTFFSIIPLITFALESFTLEPGNLKTLSLYYWTTKDQTNITIKDSVGILHNKVIWGSFLNTFLISLVVALFAGTFGILIGYATARTRGKKLSTFVSNVAFFPYLIPAMSFSAVYLAISATPTFSFLYETMPLLMLVGSIKFLPFASRSGTSSMLQVSHEIEEAAIIVGVPWHKRMLKVLFPIQKTSIISGYLLPFISSMRELSLFVLLAPAGSMILTSVLTEYVQYDAVQISNGINLIIILTVLIINLVVNKLTGASLDKGIGGN